MRRAIRACLPVMLTLVLASACYRGPAVLNPTPVGAPGTNVLPEKEYIVKVGDKLDLKFFYNPELNEQVEVRPDGRISLQLVGEIDAAGQTPSALTQELKEKYKKDLVNSEVTVMVRTFTAHRVYVDGEVAKPGVVGLTGPTTVLQAIAMSQGLKESARPTEVVIVRHIEGKNLAIPVNLESVINGTDMRQDIQLAPYDIVYVPKSNIAKTNKWVDEYLRKTILVVPTEFALYYNLFAPR